MLTSRFPLPLKRGDKLRLFHQIKYLSRQHEVILVSLTHERVEPSTITEMRSYCSEVHLIPLSHFLSLWRGAWSFLRGMPVNVGYFRASAAHRRVMELIERVQPDGIYTQLIRMAPYLEQMSEVLALDYMDAFSLRAQRRTKEGGLRALFWRKESRRLARYEASVSSKFRHKFIISQHDKEHLEASGVRHLQVLRNGVDASYFQSSGTTAKAFDLVFVGNLSYHANIAAAAYLAGQILPALRSRHPDVKVLIAGATPVRRVWRLVDASVEVWSDVQDIRLAYDAAPIFVAPIFSGSGLQNKILEAMSMGLACITTSLVHRSIGAPPGLIHVADDVEQFVGRISLLLTDQDRRIQLGEKGRSFVQMEYSWEKCNEPLTKLAVAKDVKRV